MNDSSGMPFEAAKPQTSVTTFRAVVFEKGSGILCKKISLNPDGTVKSDGSECRMSVGTAELQDHNLQTFADMIESLVYQQAIALGAFRDGIPDRVRVETKWTSAHTIFPNGRPADLIVRSAEYIQYLPGKPAPLLIDVDVKAMPGTVREKIRALGGFWQALVAALPALAPVGRVTRPSTSTGLSRVDTNERLPGSEGLHIYIVAENGADIDRFLRALHDRLWLSGSGWLMVGRAGQFLSRSIADRMVGDGCRLVFEAPALTVAPLVQDRASRKPIVVDGPALNTGTCPDLTAVQKSRLQELVATEKQRLALEAARAKADFIERMAARIVDKTGGEIDAATARHIVERQTSGVLLPHVILEFDHLGEVTVAEVLANPEQYVGQTLADPLEGTDYGPCKAMIMRRPDGALWIHSYAHGQAFYSLKHDVRSLQKAILDAPEARAADVLINMIAEAELDPIEEERLKQIVYRRDKETKAKPLGAQIKAARAAADNWRKEETRQRQNALRTDQRVQMRGPASDDERMPVMAQINEVLGAVVDDPEPPMRDLEARVAQVFVRPMPNTHALNTLNVNAMACDQMPAPEMPMLAALGECELTELIEQHIEFLNAKNRPVTLPAPFVKHYLQRKNDLALPVCSALAMLPLVTKSGELIAKQGLDRETGILFRIPEQLLDVLPKSRAQCDKAAVLRAYRRLLEVWLIDVATDLVGKTILLASVATIIERSLLRDRPAFFVTAPRRGGGKTTVLQMVVIAATGIEPPATSWSTNEEERRKSIMAILLQGAPALVWDNILRGTQITCPHIDRSCTSRFMSDRKLGFSETVTASAATIHFFTGNAIGSKGDTASRSLKVSLWVDRPDPENREFQRSDDPLDWTRSHRHEILEDIYTILLGNPNLGTDYQPPTRFKDWQFLIGSAFEYAAKAYRDEAVANGVAKADEIPEVDFKQLFLGGDDEDEQSSDLAVALVALLALLPGEFLAADLAAKLNNRDAQRTNEELANVAVLREFLFPDRVNFPNDAVTAVAVGKRLKRHLDEPVAFTGADDKPGHLTLKEVPKLGDQRHGTGKYWVARVVLQDGVAPSPTLPTDNGAAAMPF